MGVRMKLGLSYLAMVLMIVFLGMFAYGLCQICRNPQMMLPWLLSST